MIMVFDNVYAVLNDWEKSVSFLSATPKLKENFNKKRT